MEATKPSDYKAIKVWGKSLGSHAYYIENQQKTAFEDKAPLRAIYKRDDTWITYDDFAEPWKAEFEKRIEECTTK